MLEEFTPTTSQTLVRNPNYWDAPRPYLDTVKIIGVPSDPGSAAQGLITDQAQMISFGVPNPAMQIVEDAGFEPYQVAFFGGSGLSFNTRRPPFDDVRVRQAFALAVDRDLVSEQAFAGEGKLPATFFPEDSPYYDPSLTYAEHDPVAAQALIDEYLAEKGLDSIDVSLIGLAGQTEALGTSVQQQLAQLDGVNLEVKPLPILAMRDAFYQGDFDIAVYIMSGVSAYPEIVDRTGTGSFLNFMGYSNPELDALFTQIKATDDQDEIIDLWKQVGRIELDEVPISITFGSDVRTYAQDNVQNVTLYRDHVVVLEDISLG